MKNPMPVLKQCDFFLLSSYHEGLGLVLLEADTLGIPVVSTDIPGPQGFMQKYGGMLVPPDENGMYQAMQACIEGKVKPLNVDYEEYNRYAVEQFEQMLNGLLQ
jgi:CDP-glycerol glycerophosphotransferase